MTRQIEASAPGAGTTAPGGAVALALSGMLGIGVLLGPAPAAAAAGPWSLLGLPIALLAAVCAATSTAHQSDAYRGPGPAYACVRERMGLIPARVGASALLAGQVAAMAAVARVIGEFFWPTAAPQVAAVVILLVVVTATAGGRMHGVTAWLWTGLSLAVIALVVVTCWAIDPVGGQTGPVDSESAVGPLGAAGVLFFAFLGIDRLTSPDERRYPVRVVRRASMIALVVVTTALALMMIALAHQLGWTRLALSPAPIQTVLTAAAASDLAPLVRVCAAVALLPVVLGSLESFRSTAQALVREDELPRALGRIGSGGTPYLLDLLAGIAAVLVAQWVPPVSAMSFAACALLLHYAFASAGARLLLADGPKWSMRAACLGMGLAVVLAMSMPISAMLATLVVVVVGSLLAGGISRRWR